MYAGKPCAAQRTDRFQSPLASLHLTRGAGSEASLSATATLTTCFSGDERIYTGGNSFAWCRDILLGAHLSWINMPTVAIPLLNFGIQVTNPRFWVRPTLESVSSNESKSPLVLRAWTSSDNVEAFRTLHVAAHKTWRRLSCNALSEGFSSVELLADVNFDLSPRSKSESQADSSISRGYCRCTSIAGCVAVRVSYCDQDQRTCIATCGVLNNGSLLHGSLRYALTERVRRLKEQFARARWQEQNTLHF